MASKDVIGKSCEYNGKIWEIVSITCNFLGVYYGLKRGRSRAVALEGQVIISS